MEINGKKVVDAKSRIKIHITQRDATEGDNKNPSSCAAARAAKRDIPHCINARVHIGRVYVEHAKEWVRYLTPVALRTEIVAFDRGGTFQPGEYVLKAPGPSETVEGRRKAARSGTDTNRSGSGKRTKRRQKIKVAIIKRHNVTGVRPKGAVR